MLDANTKKKLNKTFHEEQLEGVTEEQWRHFEHCMEEEQVNFHRMQDDDEREWAIAQNEEQNTM